ncbi:MAG: Vitamin B12-binding protein [Verrucomicrobiae bacterium]|nr:Vitamin B12-binding protein [Verrucomicrobiae bacterium]
MIQWLSILLLAVVANAEPPQRVLSLCTTATDVLCAIGATNQLAGIDEYGRVVPGTTNVPVIAKGSALSREEVIARRFDLAFLWWYQDDAAKLLQDVGVPVVRLRAGRAAELPATVRLIGQQTGHETAAAELADELSAFLKSQTNQPAKPPRVYLELYGANITVGGDSYLNDLITLAGGTNVAADIQRSSVVFSTEQLIAAKPDVVLFVNGFTKPAIPHAHIVGIDRHWLVAGSRLAEAVAHLRALIHKEN